MLWYFVVTSTIVDDMNKLTKSFDEIMLTNNTRNGSISINSHDDNGCSSSSVDGKSNSNHSVLNIIHQDATDL